MIVTIYGSGSSGNMTIVKDKETGKCIVLDCGVHIPPMIKLEDVLGVFITHAHSDHTHCMSEWISKPIYGTLGELNNPKFIKFNYDFRYITPLNLYQIGPFSVIPYPARHDTTDPVHYMVRTNNDSLWYGCDACAYNNQEYHAAITCNKIMVECNYDEDMVEKGIFKQREYPPSLVERIVDVGHASNQYIEKRFHDVKRKLILCHISRNCNEAKRIKKVFGKNIRMVYDCPRRIK